MMTRISTKSKPVTAQNSALYRDARAFLTETSKHSSFPKSAQLILLDNLTKESPYKYSGRFLYLMITKTGTHQLSYF